MSRLFGLYSRLKDCGPLLCECPRCVCLRRTRLYRAFQRPVAEGLPLPRVGTVYFTLCPRCGGLFLVNGAAARLWLAGELPDRRVPVRCLRPLAAGQRLHPRDHGLILRRTRGDGKEEGPCPYR